MFHVSLLGPAEHVSLIVYFILVLIVAIVVVAVGRAGAVVAVEQIVAVTGNVVAEFVEDGIEALPFPLLKRSTLGYQAY